jgi:hypothetical protein
MNEASDSKKEQHRTQNRVFQSLRYAFWGGILGMTLGSLVTYVPRHVWGIDVAPIIGCAFFAMLGASFGAALGFAFLQFERTVSRRD